MPTHRWAALLLLVTGLTLSGLISQDARPVLAATVLPDGFINSKYAGGINEPTAMAFAPDGRLFVTEQGGALRVIKNGVLLSTPFVTVTTDDQGERGLLGVAFDPSYSTNRFVYVYYTATTPTVHNRVSRFTANSSNQDVALAGETIIMDLENLSSATNHNGGAIHFGPDGKLYVAVGENANGANAQTLDNRLGKILRINKDGTIPTDNPFYNTSAGQNRAIWALGLRNPFTFAFQSGTSRMFINDVGQNTWEEINDGEAGANYGWPSTEGPTSNPSYTTPLLAYRQDGPRGNGGCAIAGGAFYNPSTSPFPSLYDGLYFYADLCGGWIRVFDHERNRSRVFGTGFSGLVDLQVGPDGALYYLSRGKSAVGRISYSQANASQKSVDNFN